MPTSPDPTASAADDAAALAHDLKAPLRVIAGFAQVLKEDHATQLDRRIYRDQETRDYKRSEIIYQWENHVLPCYEQFIEPYRNNAHFVYCNDHRADEDYLRLSEQLRTLVPDRF